MIFIIYQPKNPVFRIDPDKRVYSKDDYKEVYVGELPKDTEELAKRDIDEVLELIFRLFNGSNRPTNFEGHSLSVEDIVEFRPLKEFEKGSEAFICDAFGWRKIKLERKA